MRPFRIISASIAFFALLALGAALTAADLGPRYITEDSGIATTYAVTASATSNINYTIDCRKVKDVAVQLAFKLTGAGTDNQTITFEKSLDGSKWNTIAGGKLSMVIAANGTTAVYATTNFAVGAVGYLRLATWANASAGEAATNMTITICKKIDAP